MVEKTVYARVFLSPGKMTKAQKSKKKEKNKMKMGYKWVKGQRERKVRWSKKNSSNKQPMAYNPFS